MSPEEIPIYMPGSEHVLVGVVDDDQARNMVRCGLARPNRSAELGRHLIVRTTRVVRAYERSISLSDLSRGQRFVYRQNLGNCLFAYTLKDLPGVGIRLAHEKRRPSEFTPELAALFFEVLHSCVTRPAASS